MTGLGLICSSYFLLRLHIASLTFYSAFAALESSPFAETGPRQSYVSLLVALVGAFLKSSSIRMLVSGPECLCSLMQELRHGRGFGRLQHIKIISTLVFSLPAAYGILLESVSRKVTALEKLIVFYSQQS